MLNKLGNFLLPKNALRDVGLAKNCAECRERETMNVRQADRQTDTKTSDRESDLCTERERNRESEIAREFEVWS